jgi:integrase
MACVCKKPNSPFWMAKFRDETGRIVMRSTKQKVLKQARVVAEAWEEAAVKARKGELTRATALKFLANVVERTTGEALVDATVDGFLREWLEGRKLRGRATGTVERYRPIVNAFLAFMGDRSRKSIRGVTGTDLRRFRDGEVDAGKSAVTANLSLKVLKAAFESAKREGLVLANPAAEVETLDDDGEERHAFSDAQIRKLLDAATDEWRGMILLGVHAGLRMSDAANLNWANIDAGDSITFVPKKTRRTKHGTSITIALHPDIVQWLDERRKEGHQGGVLFPTLERRPTGSHTGLSNEFGRLMEKAGIGKLLGDEKEGKGRRTTLLSFHSLRHSCVSRLANADVHADVRKKIAGHSTDEAHSRYTHLALKTQKRALKRVGSLFPKK